MHLLLHRTILVSQCPNMAEVEYHFTILDAVTATSVKGSKVLPCMTKSTTDTCDKQRQAYATEVDEEQS